MTAVAAPPRVSFTVESVPGETDGLHEAHRVCAWETEGKVSHYVGELFFNGNEWLFIRVRPDGSQVMDGLHWIPTDPDAEAHARDVRARLIAEHDPADAFLAQHDMEVKHRRDSTRELAIIGAKMEARKWWRGGYHALDHLGQLHAGIEDLERAADAASVSLADVPEGWAPAQFARFASDLRLKPLDDSIRQNAGWHEEVAAKVFWSAVESGEYHVGSWVHRQAESWDNAGVCSSCGRTVFEQTGIEHGHRPDCPRHP